MSLSAGGRSACCGWWRLAHCWCVVCLLRTATLGTEACCVLGTGHNLGLKPNSLFHYKRHARFCWRNHHINVSMLLPAMVLAQAKIASRSPQTPAISSSLGDVVMTLVRVLVVQNEKTKQNWRYNKPKQDTKVETTITQLQSNTTQHGGTLDWHEIYICNYTTRTKAKQNKTM